jgi:hypothetical protein
MKVDPLRQGDANGVKLTEQLNKNGSIWLESRNGTKVATAKLELAIGWNGIQCSRGAFK